MTEHHTNLSWSHCNRLNSVYFWKNLWVNSFWDALFIFRLANTNLDEIRLSNRLHHRYFASLIKGPLSLVHCKVFAIPYSPYGTGFSV